MDAHKIFNLCGCRAFLFESSKEALIIVPEMYNYCIKNHGDLLDEHFYGECMTTADAVTFQKEVNMKNLAMEFLKENQKNSKH